MNEFIESTMGNWLDDISKRYGDNEAVVYVDRDIRINYRQFNDYCRQVAKGLLAIGVKKGDHVSVWAPNYPEWLALIFATAKIGAALVTVNTDYKRYELEYLLSQSDTHTLLMASGHKGIDYISIVEKLLRETSNGTFPKLENIIFMPKDKEEEPPRGFTSFKQMIDFGSNISDEQLNEIQQMVKPHDVTNIQYTSGTTGHPKGVMLTHYNLLNNAKFIGDSMNLTAQDRYCISVPFHHCFGLVLSILNCVTHGATMIPIDAFSPTKVFNVVEKEKCTALNGVPAMFKIMLNHKEIGSYDLSSLRTGIMAGALCPIQDMIQAKEKMNMADIVIVYGQTESSPGITMTTLDDTLETRVSTVGRNFPGVEVKIVDIVTKKDVPDGSPGEIVARGYNIMKGYYNMPDKTIETIDKDGWLHTGDIGICENGYYCIVGRIKDMIIRGGENIYPKEIEELLDKHIGIRESQVVGIPSEVYGEEVVACIIKEEGYNITEEEVQRYVDANMSRHKVPSKVYFFTDFPTTASDKVQKFKIKESCIEKERQYTKF